MHQKIYSVLQKCVLYQWSPAMTGYFRDRVQVLLLPIQEMPSRDRSLMGGKLPSHHPLPVTNIVAHIIIKLSTVIPYLKKIQKITLHIPLVLLASAFFHEKLEIFVISGNIDKS